MSVQHYLHGQSAIGDTIDCRCSPTSGAHSFMLCLPTRLSQLLAKINHQDLSFVGCSVVSASRGIAEMPLPASASTFTVLINLLARGDLIQNKGPTSITSAD